MDDDQAQLASAQLPPTAGLIPPSPTPVTGIGHPDGGAGKTVAVIVGVAIALSLLVAVGLAVFLLVSARPGIDSAVVGAIVARAKREYPGFTVTNTTSRTREVTSSPGGREADVYVTMKNTGNPGFVWTAVYYASVAASKDASSFANTDEFFKAGIQPAQPADSFIAMWLADHPGEHPYFITETGSSIDPTRTYDVSYSRSESNAGKVTTVDGTYSLLYATATGTWSETPVTDASSAPDPVVSTDATEPLLEDPAVVDEPAVVDTATALAKALPGFVPAGEATTSNGDPLLLVRSRAYPAFRTAVAVDGLDPSDAPAEDLVVMFKGSGVKGRRFVQYFARLHPGVIVDIVMLDPDVEGDENLAWVTYVKTAAQVDDAQYEKELTVRYNPKSQTWAPEK